MYPLVFTSSGDDYQKKVLAQEFIRMLSLAAALKISSRTCAGLDYLDDLLELWDEDNIPFMIKDNPVICWCKEGRG